MKKVFKSRGFGCLITALVVGTVSVSAATYFPSNDVTYDNKESGLVSTDVQGAIDELYVKAQQVSSGASSEVVEDLGGTTTSGDGIYRDLYESGRYIYKGKNPNNYITFNGEDAGWRIISIEPDGTMKIMKIASIGNQAYDSSSNDWATSDLNTYLNGDYYNNSLNSTAKSQIVSHDFAAGAVYTNGNSVDLTDQVNAENEQLLNQKVGLATASEYLRSNSNTNFCRTIALLNKYHGTCNETNWMFNSAEWWTMSALSDEVNRALFVFSDGFFGNYNGYGTEFYVIYSHGVRPAVYLSSSVKLSGKGTLSEPYTIN